MWGVVVLYRRRHFLHLHHPRRFLWSSICAWRGQADLCVSHGVHVLRNSKRCATLARYRPSVKLRLKPLPAGLFSFHPNLKGSCVLRSFVVSIHAINAHGLRRAWKRAKSSVLWCSNRDTTLTRNRSASSTSEWKRPSVHNQPLLGKGWKKSVPPPFLVVVGRDEDVLDDIRWFVKRNMLGRRKIVKLPLSFR